MRASQIGHCKGESICKLVQSSMSQLSLGIRGSGPCPCFVQKGAAWRHRALKLSVIYGRDINRADTPGRGSIVAIRQTEPLDDGTGCVDCRFLTLTLLIHWKLITAVSDAVFPVESVTVSVKAYAPLPRPNCTVGVAVFAF